MELVPSPIPGNVKRGSTAKLRVHGDGFERSPALTTPLSRHRQLTFVSAGARSNSYSTPTSTTTAMTAAVAAIIRLGRFRARVTTPMLDPFGSPARDRRE